MENNLSLPLLLLDNSAAMTVLDEGEFKCYNLSLDEAKSILEMHEEDDVLRCFNNADIEIVMYEHLGIAKRNFAYKKIRSMRPGQDAIVFKLYVTPSETQPIVKVDGVEAKKIQNIYVYCQYLTRIN